jgi:hypothetical protein
MYECDNIKSDEFWEFGRKNHGKRSFGSKDMALEDFKGKIVFLGCSGGICGILEWLEGFGVNDRGSCEGWKIFRDFCGFLEWLRT